MILSMLVIGGSMSVSGAFFGTILVTILRQSLRQVEQTLSRGGIEASGSTDIVVAILMIVFLIWKADGITGGGELSWDSIQRTIRKMKKRFARFGKQEAK